MIYNEWLSGLKVGDKVMVAYDGIPSVSKVDKVTPTQIVVGNHRYSVKSGSVCGDTGWRTLHLEEPTEEALAEMRNRIRRDALRQTTWGYKHFTDEAITAIYNLVQTVKTVTEGAK